MTREELQLALLQRRNRKAVFHSAQVAEAMGITEKGLIEKIRKLNVGKNKIDEKFLQTHFVGRAYNAENNVRRVYYDLTTQGVMLMLLTQQSNDFRIAMIEKLMSLL